MNYNLIKKFCLLILLLLSNTSCQKEGSLPTGDILGKIVFRNDDFSYPDGKSAEVRLYSDTSLIDVVTTDLKGIYRFTEKPYGKYRIDIIADNYVIPGNWYFDFYFFHVGGASPTIIRNCEMSEIPSFKLTIDSVIVNRNSDKPIKLLIKVNGGILRPNASLVAFLSNSPEVSKDKYLCIARGTFQDRDYSIYPTQTIPVFAYLNEFGSGYNSLKTGILYVRLYPLAAGQNLSEYFNWKALGKPADAFAFYW